MNSETPDISFLLSHSDILLCQIGQDLSVKYLSPCWEAHLATLYTPAIYLDFKQLVHEIDRDCVVHAIETAFKPPISDIKFSFRPVSSKPATWFQCHGQLVYQFDAWTLVLVAIDETKLGQLNCNFENFSPSVSSDIEAPNIGYWQLNTKTQKLSWSDEVFKIHGVNKNNYTPTLKSSFQLYHKDDVDTARNYLSEAINKGVSWRCKFRITQTNGELRSIISQGTAHIGDSGNIDTIFGILQDITEYQKLKNELDMLGFAVNKTTVGIVVTDSKRCVLWLNDAFSKLSGFSYEEVAGKNLALFLQGPKTDSATTLRIRESLNAGKVVNEKILNYHKSGRIYWNNLIITPVFNNKKITHFVGIQHDITTEVESKLKLENINLSLEKIVKERTIALEKANQELNHLAKKDPLTGAFNRRAYYEQMDIEIKRCSRLEKACSIALIDVDFFKIVNDQYGHSAGDTVLISLVRLMTSKKRELDHLFRLGGEEFLLLMPCTDNREALIVTERIRHSIEHMKIEYEKIKISVTVSIGLITETRPKFDEDYLKKVDHYLYQAKANGRNQIAEAGSSPV